MICDYFVIRRRVLVVDDLYLRGGTYEYSRGFNWLAVLALALGAGTALVGLVVPALRVLYELFVVCGICGVVRGLLCADEVAGRTGDTTLEEAS